MRLRSTVITLPLKGMPPSLRLAIVSTPCRYAISLLRSLARGGRATGATVDRAAAAAAAAADLLVLLVLLIR
jgi:hypothetical protein